MQSVLDPLHSAAFARHNDNIYGTIWTANVLTDSGCQLYCRSVNKFWCCVLPPKDTYQVAMEITFLIDVCP